MRKLAALGLALALGGCATASDSGDMLDRIVTGPAKICLRQVSFNLPANGRLLEVRPGVYGVGVAGSIGDQSFEITESDRFVTPEMRGDVVVRGTGFVVETIGDTPGSYGVYVAPSAGQPQSRLLLRIEHFFSAGTVTAAEFFGALDVNGREAGGCAQTFG